MIYHFFFIVGTLAFFAGIIPLARHRIWYGDEPVYREALKGSAEYNDLLNFGFQPEAERSRGRMLMKLKPDYYFLADAQD